MSISYLGDFINPLPYRDVDPFLKDNGSFLLIYQNTWVQTDRARNIDYLVDQNQVPFCGQSCNLFLVDFPLSSRNFMSWVY